MSETRNSSLIATLNSAEKKTSRMILETIARRSAQGWTAEQIGKRIWHCYGHLYSVQGNVLCVKMAGGDQRFEIGSDQQ